ncbi:porin family protein [Spirosoma arcticum]
MKKTYLFAFLMTVVGNMALAQTVTFGLKAGVNVPSVSSDFSPATDGKEGLALFHGGAIVDVGISNHFSIQPQLLYNGKGLKFHDPTHGHTVTLNSVDLPVYAVYKMAKGFYAGVGPNFGFNVSGKSISTMPGDVPHPYKLDGSAYDFKRFDLGVSALAGYQHKSGLFVSANYLKGLTNVFNNPGYNWSNNVLAFSAGYMFKSTKRTGENY